MMIKILLLAYVVIGLYIGWESELLKEEKPMKLLTGFLYSQAWGLWLLSFSIIKVIDYLKDKK